MLPDYMPGKQNRRSLISVEECVVKEKSLQNHSIYNKDPFLKITLADKVLNDKEDLHAYGKRITEERNENWKEKTLLGEYIKQTEEVIDENSLRWLKNGQLKKETEGLIIDAQDQTLRANAIKRSIDKTGDLPQSICFYVGIT